MPSMPAAAYRRSRTSSVCGRVITATQSRLSTARLLGDDDAFEEELGVRVGRRAAETRADALEQLRREVAADVPRQRSAAIEELPDDGDLRRGDRAHVPRRHRVGAHRQRCDRALLDRRGRAPAELLAYHHRARREVTEALIALRHEDGD